ncbi:type IV pilus biogenesis protein PilM [Brenneria izbisi]|uniref:Pilus assembly protein PilM n=1 Tax=Brenneria izbisi TaxID=2939450 RepID=A0AA42C5R8_9GAMM|nr:pilus assembly protein PilM [Brenneria izbisi]MCV9879441.1 pilus assembly protein PilM [Brenneria izbisi]MCV9882641.1 pilus assembly protein PilM [Brenneria izbisi]
MAYHIWRVGLDIQNGFMRALAVQQRRNGWQLRHWWQFPLPDDTLHLGSLHHTEALCEVLRQWRRLLPRHISLRVAFPAQQVLQQRLPAPDSRLREPERSRYIESMAARKLPISSDSLSMDYRADPHAPDALLITAARRSELARWIACLQAADLHPDVVDISACAIRCMARLAGLESNRVFLHRSIDGWLWVSPLNHAFHFGMIHGDEWGEESAILPVIRARYGQDIGDIAYYSSTSSSFSCSREKFDELLPWSPLVAFSHMQAPVPDFPPAFVIASGLALRPGDA